MFIYSAIILISIITSIIVVDKYKPMDNCNTPVTGIPNRHTWLVVYTAAGIYVSMNIIIYYLYIYKNMPMCKMKYLFPPIIIFWIIWCVMGNILIYVNIPKCNISSDPISIMIAANDITFDIMLFGVLVYNLFEMKKTRKNDIQDVYLAV